MVLKAVISGFMMLNIGGDASLAERDATRQVQPQRGNRHDDVLQRAGNLDSASAIAVGLDVANHPGFWF